MTLPACRRSCPACHGTGWHTTNDPRPGDGQPCDQAEAEEQTARERKARK